MANLAAKDVFNSYGHVLQPFRRMRLAKSLPYRELVEAVWRSRTDTSEALRLNLTPGTKVLAPADMRLEKVTGGQDGSATVVFTNRKYEFTFYHLAFIDGLSSGAMIKAGSVIGVVKDAQPGDLVETPSLHLMVTRKSSGMVVDAMKLVEKAKILPPFMPKGFD